MIRRPPTWLSILGILVAAAVDGVVAVVGVVGVVGAIIGVALVVVNAADAAVITFVGAVGVVAAVAVVVAVVGAAAQIRGRRIRRTRSSGASGGLELRVSLGGNTRRLLHACTSVDRLVDYLLDRTVEKLPAAASARFAEEWQDHRQHYSGWRLVWWALWVRATALRTVTALGPARLPRDS